MNQFFLTLIIVAALFGSCNSDDSSSSMEEEQMTDPLESSNDFDLLVEILTPLQDRDFSYHNNGEFGVFEHPDSLKQFTGSISIDNMNSGNPIAGSDITITWRSNLDGVLFQGSPNDTLGTTTDEMLSKGVHTIYLEAAVPSANVIVKDSVIVSNVISISSESTGTSVNLNWTKYLGNDFISYLVYNQSTEPIAEIFDVNTLFYEDTEANSLVEDRQYQIVVKNSGNYGHVVGSHFDYNHPGIFIEFPYFVHKIIKDPFRPKIYGITRPRSNSDEADKYGIVILNIEGDVFEIESHILIDERYADLDISPDGQYLFICQRLVEKITRVDLNSMAIETFPTDTNGWGIHKIEVGQNNILYGHRTPPSSGSTQFWIYDGNNGDLLNGPTGGTRHGDIEFSVASNFLFSGTSNSTNSVVYKHGVVNNQINIVGQFAIAESFPDAFILLAENNQSLFWEEYEMDLDLNLIRVFESKIKACSPNSEYMADFDKVYNYTTQNINYEFPELPPSENTSLVFPEDQVLILSRADSQVFPGEVTYFFKIPLN